MSQTQNRKKWGDILRLLKKGLQHLFLHNGGFKLLAVVLSVLLWAGLISQDPSVTRMKVFQNVNIKIINSDSDRQYTNKGRIVTSDLSELLEDVSITASVPQLQYENADASAYNLRVDLDEIRANGEAEQELRIQYDDNSEYGEIVNISPSTIKVRVEELFTYQKVPITVRTEGEAPDGWYIEKPTVAPTTVSVSGPISIVKEVSRGITTLDLNTLEWEEDTIRDIGEIRLINRRGDEIKSPLLVISSEGNQNDTVLIETSMMPTRNYSVRDMIQFRGALEPGYMIVDEPVYSPEYVTIASSTKKLDALETLQPDARANQLLETGYVDLTGLSETRTFNIAVKSISDGVILSSDTISITVDIAKIAEDPPPPLVDETEDAAEEAAADSETAENPQP